MLKAAIASREYRFCPSNSLSPSAARYNGHFRKSALRGRGRVFFFFLGRRLAVRELFEQQEIREQL
jgi:hypothetical protein